MQRTRVERMTTAQEIVCDRCGMQARRAACCAEFEWMTPIGFAAEEGSIFVLARRVEIDLCDSAFPTRLGSGCEPRRSLSGRLGQNRRDVTLDVAAAILRMRHCTNPMRPPGLTHWPRHRALWPRHRQRCRRPGSSTFGWIAGLFNRLANGATLEKIETSFPAISRRAANDALRGGSAVSAPRVFPPGH